MDGRRLPSRPVSTVHGDAPRCSRARSSIRASAAASVHATRRVATVRTKARASGNAGGAVASPCEMMSKWTV
eukprot:scaffold81097_cov66-Phaeocystis_antarctica.AAC.2